MLESLKYAQSAVDVASEKQATDILLLDISNVSGFTDFFVIMTAGSRRQMEALSEDVLVMLKSAGASLYHREGNTASGWLLLDFGDLVIHVFAPEQRAFYRLEDLWSIGKELVRIQ